MREPRTFDVQRDDLPQGIVLVEASAGTGKTFTVTAAVLRMVAESPGIPLERMLVVTFTNAATSELRERIRRRLNEALERWEDATEEPGACQDVLVARLREATGEAGRDRVLSARRSLDRMPLGTLHAICLAMLRDHGRSIGLAGIPEVGPPDAEMEREVAAEWFRSEVFARGALAQAVAARAGLSPDALLAFQRATAIASELDFVPEPPGVDEALQTLEEALEAARSRATEIASLVLGAGLKKADKTSWLRALMPLEAERRLAPEASPAARESVLGAFADLVHGKQLLKKSQEAVEADERWPIIRAVGAAGEALVDALRARFARDHARAAEVNRRAQDRFAFDDMTTLVDRALRDPDRGPDLAAAIRSAYDVAFIDEFQDTDARQWAIFQALFPDGPLWLVGDPKQAIYGFRGADLETYLAVRDDVDHELGLTRNFRSTGRLIDGLNAVHGSADDPFLSSELRYAEISAGLSDDAPQLSGALTGSSPVQVLWWEPSEAPRRKNALVAKAREEARLYRAVAARCARWLDGTHSLGTRPVRAADVAILVRKGAQARSIASALTDLAIPVTVSVEENVLLGESGQELRLLVDTALDPADRLARRRALLTRTVGCSGEDLLALDAEAIASRAIGRVFEDASLRIRELGVEAMVRGVLASRGTDASLAEELGGETFLLDLLEAAGAADEALATGETDHAGLVSWIATGGGAGGLARKRAAGPRDAVQVMTIHKSKGLEFPIVICPALWDAGDADRISLHAPRDRDRVGPSWVEPLVVPLPGARANVVQRTPVPPELRDRAFVRAFEEEARITYVALTRAAQHLDVVLAPLNGAQFAPLTWLLLGGLPDAEMTPAARLRGLAASVVSDAHTGSLRTRLEERSAFRDGAVELTDLAPADGAPATRSDAPATSHAALPLQRLLGGLETRTPLSFTRLTRRDVSVDTVERSASRGVVDEGEPLEASILEETVTGDAEVPCDLASFAAGARAGSALHAVLERALPEIGAGHPIPDDLVARALARQGLDLAAAHPDCANPVGAVETWLDGFVTRPLLAGGTPVADIASERQFHEWPFQLGVARLAPADLADALRVSEHPWLREHAQEARELDGRALIGNLKGFIDLLVLHEDHRAELIDWKSQSFDRTLGAFDLPSLRQEMVHAHYVLQALIYAVAVRRFLRQRGIDDPVMEARWIFLRGTAHPTSRGVCEVPLEPQVLDVLDARLTMGAVR